MSPSCMSSYEVSARKRIVTGASARQGCAWPCTYRFGVVRWLHPLAVEEESDTLHVLSLAVAERVHELAELGCALDLEEDLVVVVGNFDVQVLLLAIFWLLLHRRAVVRHFGCGWRGGLTAGVVME